MTESSQWKREALDHLLLETIKEHCRRRRWGIFFKSISLLIFLAVMLFQWGHSFRWIGYPSKRVIGLVNVQGIIRANSLASAENVINSLQQAFSDVRTAAVLLRINSPGGSPVQAAQIYDEIRYQRQKHPKKPILAICDDSCASAAYYIAAASDQIYASPASVIGSIGVVINDFGFVEGLRKLGIERRILTAGERKGFLDPFLPLKPEDTQYAHSLLSDLHQQFIEAVKAGRGQRLKDIGKMSETLFSGLVWTGKQALPLGLIDGFGNLNFIARKVLKIESIVDYTVRPNVLQKLFDSLGSASYRSMSDHLSTGLGEIAVRSR